MASIESYSKFEIAKLVELKTLTTPYMTGSNPGFYSGYSSFFIGFLSLTKFNEALSIQNKDYDFVIIVSTCSIDLGP